MSYTLVSTEYVPAEGGAQLIQGVKGNRVPRGAIKGGNGTFVVHCGYIPAQFKFLFEDQNGKSYFFEAYSEIKSCMKTKNLTQKKRTLIIEEIDKISKESSKYIPEEWVEKAVNNLMI